MTFAFLWVTHIFSHVGYHANRSALPQFMSNKLLFLWILCQYQTADITERLETWEEWDSEDFLCTRGCFQAKTKHTKGSKCDIFHEPDIVLITILLLISNREQKSDIYSYENVPDYFFRLQLRLQFSLSFFRKRAGSSLLTSSLWVNCPFSLHAVYHLNMFTVCHQACCCLTIHLIWLMETVFAFINILAHFHAPASLHFKDKQWQVILK